MRRRIRQAYVWVAALHSQWLPFVLGLASMVVVETGGSFWELLSGLLVSVLLQQRPSNGRRTLCSSNS